MDDDAFSNVVVCAGSDSFNPGGHGNSSDLDGIFFTLFDVRIADVTDGTSNTVMVSEILPVRHKPPSTWDVRGQIWNARHGGALFSALNPPNSAADDIVTFCISTQDAPCTASTSEMTVAARSMHPGIANALRVDGSAHTISEDIDVNAYRALASLNGGN